MALWTDLIDPATLTGYARASLEDYERSKGSLNRWLPNREVADTVVRFVKGRTGLVHEARFRAFDAEPETGGREPTSRVILELPALGQTQPIGEYEQLRLRNAPDQSILNAVLNQTRNVVIAVSDAIERLRGVVLDTGKATVSQDNFQIADDFGRSATHNVTAATPWSDPDADILADITAWVDLYVEDNGTDPGALVMSSRVIRAMAANHQFRTALIDGASRPATETQVFDTLSGAGLPPIVKYDRRTYSGRVLPDDKVLVLPAEVGPDAWESTELGATFWGQTLTSMDSSYAIAADEQPGIVVGTYKNEKPPIIAEVISDAIAMPVLANADLSISADVL